MLNFFRSWVAPAASSQQYIKERRQNVAKYRSNLPQLVGDFFLTDGGIETTLVFHEGQELPHIAAFHLLATDEGTQSLKKYFRSYGELARNLGTGLILESATWRANPDWAARLGYNDSDLERANRKAVALLEEIRQGYETSATPIVISGCVGPRGDGYVPDSAMSAEESQAYHRAQINTFAQTEADLVTAITMNYAEEAIGVALAAKEARLPVVIAFTVETDGKLPTGQALSQAIGNVDEATDGYPAYFMINCAHPSHFDHVLRADEPWVQRIRGLRANASRMSHAELDNAPQLDMGNPVELAREYATLKKELLKQLNVMGGCCGTDVSHIKQIAESCLPLFQNTN